MTDFARYAAMCRQLEQIRRIIAATATRQHDASWNCYFRMDRIGQTFAVKMGILSKTWFHQLIEGTIE